MSCSECVICYEVIGTTNVVTTECGHLFHCSCLMKNASVNGFGCPMCRTEMAPNSKPEQDEEDEDEDDDDDDEEEEEDDEFDDQADYIVDLRSDPEEQENYALRGLRWMFTRAELEESIQLDGNSLALSPVSMRRNARIYPTTQVSIARDLEQELDDVSDESINEDEEIESEANWQRYAEREKKLDAMTNTMIKKFSARVPYQDLWKAYLAISDPEIFYGGVYEKADTKIIGALGGDIERINQVIYHRI